MGASGYVRSKRPQRGVDGEKHSRSLTAVVLMM